MTEHMTEPTIGRYTECIPCSKKVGSPILCKSCLENRETINKLNDEILRQSKIINLIKEVTNL